MVTYINIAGQVKANVSANWIRIIHPYTGVFTAVPFALMDLSHCAKASWDVSSFEQGAKIGIETSLFHSRLDGRVFSRAPLGGGHWLESTNKTIYVDLEQPELIQHNVTSTGVERWLVSELVEQNLVRQDVYTLNPQPDLYKFYREGSLSAKMGAVTTVARNLSINTSSWSMIFRCLPEMFWDSQKSWSQACRGYLTTELTPRPEAYKRWDATKKRWVTLTDTEIKEALLRGVEHCSTTIKELNPPNVEILFEKKTMSIDEAKQLCSIKHSNLDRRGTYEFDRETNCLVQGMGELCTDVINQTQLIDANGIAFIKEAPEVFSQLAAYQRVLSSTNRTVVRDVSSAALATKYGLNLTLADLKKYREGLAELASDCKRPCSRRARRNYAFKHTGASGTAKGYIAYKLTYLPGSSRALLALMKALDNIGLAPTTSNIWDLVPYSFVVNWFIDFDAMFSALDANIRGLALDIVSETRTSAQQFNVLAPSNCRLSYEWYERVVHNRLTQEPLAGSILNFTAEQHMAELTCLSLNGMWSSLVKVI